MTKQLAMDLELVRIAFEDREGQGQWFLDRETGEVAHVTDEPDDAPRARLDERSRRWIAIPYQGPEPTTRDLADFLASVADHRRRALLEAALDTPRAAVDVADVLRDIPAERERWLGFHAERARRGSDAGWQARASSPSRRPPTEPRWGPHVTIAVLPTHHT